MPSQYDTFRSTQQKINSNLAFNRAVTRTRFGGTQSILTVSGFNDLARPATLPGSSNDGLNSTFVGGSGPNASAITYATGTAFGAADDVSKYVEVGISNQNEANYDGINGKTSQKEVSIGASGIRILRDGTYISVTGAVLTPPLAVVSAASGTDENIQDGRTTALDYTYRYGLTNTDKSLGLRSQ